MLMASGVVWVGVGGAAWLALGLPSVGEGLVLVGCALLAAARRSAGGGLREQDAGWVRRKPTRANRTSRIRAISGQVQGLRPRRCGSSAGSSSYCSSSWTQLRSAARASARDSVLPARVPRRPAAAAAGSAPAAAPAAAAPSTGSAEVAVVGAFLPSR